MSDRLNEARPIPYNVTIHQQGQYSEIIQPANNCCVLVLGTSCALPLMSVLTLSWSFSYNLKNYEIVNRSASDGNFIQYWSNLTYNATAQDNSRTLTCTASGSSSSSSQMININVILAPNYPVITGPDSSNASVSYTWSCLSTGASYIPPNVYWRTENGDALIDGVSKSNMISQKPNANNMYTITSTITMPLPPTFPEYILECRVVHFLNPYTIEKSAIMNVTVLYPLQIITINEPNVTTNEAQDVTLVCNISSSPSASKVIWYKDGIILDLNSTRYTGGNVSVPNLTIIKVSKLDAGNYTCTAVNQQGTGSSPNTGLIIKYGPTVTVSNTNITKNAGETIVLTCTVNSFPPITKFYWLKSDTTVINCTVNPSKYSGGSITNPTLVINNASSSDISNYTCVAENSAGTGRSNPVFVNLKNPPSITNDFSNVTVTSSASFNLTCAVSVISKVNIVFWTKKHVHLFPSRMKPGTLVCDQPVQI
ncbi:hypothetical protein Btru_038472 [Bulinus truncatus]|nr:hypothetical protein Btru_038472 [Bulinus truncatus]